MRSINRRRWLAFLVMFTLVFATVQISIPKAAYASGTTYYVDSVSGSDSNNGTSTSTPWQSLSKVNGTAFSPGDSILFKGGDTWSGSLVISSSGNSSAQITYGSYGTGMPKIDGGSYVKTIDSEGHEYITIENFEVTNYHPSDINTTLRYGIYADAKASGISHNLIINNVDVHDVDGIYSWDENANNQNRFNDSAIYITYSGNGGELSSSNHWDGITVENSNVYGNYGEGVMVTDEYGPLTVTPYNTNVVVQNTTISNNADDNLILFYSDAPVVQNVLSYDSGQLASDTLAYSIIGIWAVASTDATFKNNEVARTRLPSVDGTAFDIDWGESGTFTHEYNYTHGNEGGIIDNCLYCNSVQGSFNQSIFRYNISVDDLNNIINVGYQGTWQMYNNVFYKSSGHLELGDQSSTVTFTNNVFDFQTAPSTWGNDVMDHNAYYPISASPSDSHAVTGDPKFVNPGAIGDGMSYAANYKTQSGSSLIDAGTSISGNGGYDFFGNTVPYNGTTDIGAYEYQGGSTATPTPTSSTIILGTNTVLGSSDSGNSTYMSGFEHALSQSATIQSLSFYVATAAGNLRLGIYSDNSGVPGTLKAWTNEFAATSGWNTQNVTSQVVLPAGNYWLVFLTDNDSMVGKVATGSGTSYFVHPHTYGALPSTFPSGTSVSSQESFYATLIP